MNDYNKNNVKNSQTLRKNMTPQERHLWYDFLSQLDVTINRQKVIGNYIVDFYCAKYKLVIEIDGTQHYEKNGKEKDAQRDVFLKGKGLNILRYGNNQINEDFEAVCEDVLNHMK